MSEHHGFYVATQKYVERLKGAVKILFHLKINVKRAHELNVHP